MGGWMALPHSDRNDSDEDYYGKLMFVFARRSGQELPQRPRQQQRQYHCYQLKSHIVDYRPRLLGSSTPTEAYVHAYVTFRFHRALQVNMQGETVCSNKNVCINNLNLES
jgi:hypothetical protein